MANVRIGSVSNLLNMSTHLSKWHRYFRFLPFIYLAVLFILWIFATPAFVQAGCVVFLLVNTLIHYWNKNYVETYIRPLFQLHKMRIAVIKLSRIEKRESSLNMDESIHEINHLSKKIGVFSLDRLMESEFSIIFYSIVELVKILFLIEPIYTNLILTKIHHINSHSRKLINYIGEWDVLYSVSSLRAWMKREGLLWCVPTLNPNGSFHAEACIIR